VVIVVVEPWQDRGGGREPPYVMLAIKFPSKESYRWIASSPSRLVVLADPVVLDLVRFNFSSAGASPTGERTPLCAPASGELLRASTENVGSSAGASGFRSLLLREVLSLLLNDMGVGGRRRTRSFSSTTGQVKAPPLPRLPAPCSAKGPGLSVSAPPLQSGSLAQP